MMYPHISAIASAIAHRYTLADMRAANGVNGAIGMDAEPSIDAPGRIGCRPERRPKWRRTKLPGVRSTA